MISANIDRKTRKAVYRRDHYRCALCDSPKNIQVHHAIPRGQGGAINSVDNMITLCQHCHMLAHGQAPTDEYWASPGEIAQLCIEYLADIYEPGWWPWRPGYHPGTYNQR